jgi:hypothetical protein
LESVGGLEGDDGVTPVYSAMIYGMYCVFPMPSTGMPHGEVR